VTLMTLDAQGKEEEGQDLDSMTDKYRLTRREREILGLALDGLTVKQMASQLYVTEGTVKFHISNVLKKTGAENRATLLEMIRS